MPAVVLHGGSGRRQQADGLPALLPQACDVVVPDLRGHGESSHTPGRYRLEDFAGDVASLCDALFDGEPAIIYGHSLGGQVALGRAGASVEVAGGAADICRHYS